MSTYYGFDGVIGHILTSPTLATGVATVLPFNDKEILVSDAKAHSTTTNPSRFIATRDGLYTVECTVAFTSLAAVGHVKIGYDLNGGNAPVYLAAQPTTTTAHAPVLNFSKTLHMALGDYIELVAFQNAVATTTISIAETQVLFRKL